MTKKELYKAAAKKAGTTIKAATPVVDAVFDVITETLGAHEEVRIQNFGSWTFKVYSERVGRNPMNGEEVMIPARNLVKFNAYAPLKQAVK